MQAIDQIKDEVDYMSTHGNVRAHSQPRAGEYAPFNTFHTQWVVRPDLLHPSSQKDRVSTRHDQSVQASSVMQHQVSPDLLQ